MNVDLCYAQGRLDLMVNSLDIELNILAHMVQELVRHQANPVTLTGAETRLTGLSSRLQWSLRALQAATRPSIDRKVAPPPPMQPIFDDDVSGAAELKTDGLAGDYGFWQFLSQDPEDPKRWHVRCLVCNKNYTRAANPIRYGTSRCCLSCFNRYGAQIDILLDILQPGRRPTIPEALLNAPTGDFGFWLYLSESDKTPGKNWHVRCLICKRKYVRPASSLRRGDSSSCRDCARQYGGQIHQVLASRPAQPERDEIPKPPTPPKAPLGDFAFWQILGTAEKGRHGKYLRVLCLLCNKDYDRLAAAIRGGHTRCCQDCSRKYPSQAIGQRLKEVKQDYAKATASANR